MARAKRTLFPLSLYRVGFLLSLLVLGTSGHGMQISAQAAHNVPANPLANIKHIIFIIKENHTFDSYFGEFPGVDGTKWGYTSTSPNPIRLRPAADKIPNFRHTWQAAHTDYDQGFMDAFDLGSANCGPPSYQCYIEVRPQNNPISHYWELARHFVLNDHGFSSLMGPSFPNHLYTVAAEAGPTISTSAINNPTNPPHTLLSWGCSANPNTTMPLFNGNTARPCFGCPQPSCLPRISTLADELASAGYSWKYYTPMPPDPGFTLNALDSFYQDYQLSNKIVDQSTFDNDAARGSLPNFSWLVPPNNVTEHPGSSSSCAGEKWTIARINAVENSPDWSSSLIVVTWDDFGGLYDHVVPSQKDALGPGFRVPFLIISPFARAHDDPNNPHVSHIPLEFSSVIRLAEQVFNLPLLGNGQRRDASSGGLRQDLDFSHTTPRLILPTTTC